MLLTDSPRLGKLKGFGLRTTQSPSVTGQGLGPLRRIHRKSLMLDTRPGLFEKVPWQHRSAAVGEAEGVAGGGGPAGSYREFAPPPHPPVPGQPSTLAALSPGCAAPGNSFLVPPGHPDPRASPAHPLPSTSPKCHRAQNAGISAGTAEPQSPSEDRLPRRFLWPRSRPGEPGGGRGGRLHICLLLQVPWGSAAG